MRQANLSRFAFTALILLAATLRTATVSAKEEYFTDEEIDYIRDAQGLAARVPALLRLANIRLVVLSLKEKSKEDKDLEKRIAEIHEELIGNPAPKPSERPPSAPRTIPLPGPIQIPIPLPSGSKEKEIVGRPYLTELTPVEILRGYVEALEEIKGDIDDAYRDKLEIRSPLEQFEKFCNTSLPLLRKFQSHNAAELQAIEDARSTTQESLDDAQEGLKKIPKTEKSSKP